MADGNTVPSERGGVDLTIQGTWAGESNRRARLRACLGRIALVLLSHDHRPSPSSPLLQLHFAYKARTGRFCCKQYSYNGRLVCPEGIARGARSLVFLDCSHAVEESPPHHVVANASSPCLAGPTGSTYVACALPPGNDSRFWVNRIDDAGTVLDRVSVVGSVPALCPARHSQLVSAPCPLTHLADNAPVFVRFRPHRADSLQGKGGGVPWSLEMGPDGRTLFVSLHWASAFAEAPGGGGGGPDGDEDDDDYVLPTLKPIHGECAIRKSATVPLRLG